MNDAATTAIGAGAAAPPLDWPLARAEVRFRIAVLALAFLALHADIVFRIAWVAVTDGDWSHALLIPLISAYFVYQQRSRLAAAAYRTCWPGLAVMAAAAAVYALALARGLDTLKGYAMIAHLGGLVLLLCGPGAVRLLAVPILYLAFAVKLPDELWTQIAWRLQLLAAHCGVFTLKLLGVDAIVTATTIELWTAAEMIGSLDVAEACSGMRMLMTFLALSVVFAFLADRSWWARLAMIAAAAPIALLVNVARVSVLGLLYLIDPQYARGDFHVFMGMLMLIPAILLFLASAWAIGLADDRWGRGRAARAAADPSPPGGGREGEAPIAPSARRDDDDTAIAQLPSPSASRGEGGSRIAWVTALALLLVAAAALYAPALAQGRHVLKLGTEIRRHLYSFPEHLGPYQLTDRQQLSHEMTDEMGTQQYLLATYSDSGRGVTMLLAYHTAMPDARPYVSPRCFVAGGIDSRDHAVQTRTLHVRPRGGEAVELPVNLVQIASRSATLGRSRDFIVFTHAASGRFIADRRAVADRLFDPAIGEQWYCRIELLLSAETADEAADRAAAFLAHALPPIMDHLPLGAARSSGPHP